MSHRIYFNLAILATLLMGLMSATGCQWFEDLEHPKFNEPSKPAEVVTPTKPDGGTVPLTAKVAEPAKVAETPKAPAKEITKVEAGDNIPTIAKREGVAMAALMLVNEELVEAKFEKLCGDDKPQTDAPSAQNVAYRGTLGHDKDEIPVDQSGSNQTERSASAYCTGTGTPFDKIQAGWELKLPPTLVTADVQADMDKVGKRVAIIMRDSDKTGPEVAAHVYELLGAAKKAEKVVYLIRYGKDAEGTDFVREFRAGGVRYNTEETDDAIGLALEWARQEKPDAVFIVTDRGGSWKGKKIPNFSSLHVACFGEDAGCAALNSIDSDLRVDEKPATPAPKK